MLWTFYESIKLNQKEKSLVNNLFLKQFAKNIKFSYTSFDRIVMRGYIRRLFYEGGLVLFLRAMGFKKLTNGVLRIFNDQLNSHIKKEAERLGIPIIWWPSTDGGKTEPSLSMWKSAL